MMHVYCMYFQTAKYNPPKICTFIFLESVLRLRPLSWWSHTAFVTPSITKFHSSNYAWLDPWEINQYLKHKPNLHCNLSLSRYFISEGGNESDMSFSLSKYLCDINFFEMCHPLRGEYFTGIRILQQKPGVFAWQIAALSSNNSRPLRMLCRPLAEVGHKKRQLWCFHCTLLLFFSQILNFLLHKMEDFFYPRLSRGGSGMG